MNLKIQILAGNTLMSRFHVGFEIELPLAMCLELVDSFEKQLLIHTYL